jgi:hypothetical protein
LRIVFSCGFVRRTVPQFHPWGVTRLTEAQISRLTKKEPEQFAPALENSVSNPDQ